MIIKITKSSQDLTFFSQKIGTHVGDGFCEKHILAVFDCFLRHHEYT